MDVQILLAAQLLWIICAAQASHPCGKPPTIANSVVAEFSVPGLGPGGSDVHYAVYSCNSNEGYVLKGNASIVCIDGLWSPTQASCAKVECLAPPPSMNGGSHNLDSKFRNSMCQPWSNQYTSCSPISTPFYTQYVTYTCAQGFQFLNSSVDVVSTCTETGNWSPPQISCQPVDCGPPQYTVGLQCNNTSTTYQQVSTCACLKGYQRSCQSQHYYSGNYYAYCTNFQVTCQYTGSWTTPSDGRSGQCERVNCGTPPDVAKTAEKIVEGTWYEDKTRYRCEKGYAFEENVTVICQADGTWSERPTCVLLDCGPPDDLLGGVLSYKSTTYLSTATYYCRYGYVMTGSPIITCSDLGTWTQSPLCQRVRCGEPPKVGNSSRLVHGFYYLDTASYYCDVGFQLLGNINSTCSANGFWTAPPECAKISCGAPPEVKYASVQEITDLKFGQRLNYQCFTDHELRGVPYVTCLPSAQWTQPPTCEPKRVISKRKPKEYKDMETSKQSLAGDHIERRKRK